MHSSGNARSATRLYAYGTLRAGTRIHRRLCRGVVEVVPGWVWGRLHLLAEGFPALEVPPDTVLAEAAGVAADDHARFLHTRVEAPGPRASPWRRVRGEVIVFPDQAEVWRQLDQWEDLWPERLGPYRRVLLPVELEHEAHTTAWAYVAGALPPGARPFDGDEWPGAAGAG